MKNIQQRPRVVDYLDYRLYLSEWYAHRSSLNSVPPYRLNTFSKSAGFRSPKHLELVFEGKRNLSTKNIEKFSRTLELDDEEEDYFSILVLFNQAETLKTRNQYAELLTQTAAFQNAHPQCEVPLEYENGQSDFENTEMTTSITQMSIPEITHNT